MTISWHDAKRHIRGRVYDFSELADRNCPDFVAAGRPIPKNRRPDPAFNPDWSTMPFRTFQLPVQSAELFEAELNGFLRSHRVLNVERHFVPDGEHEPRTA